MANYPSNSFGYQNNFMIFQYLNPVKQNDKELYYPKGGRGLEGEPGFPLSPFAKSNSSFILYLEPVLNRYYQTYQNVITLNTMPSGPLADMVTQISTSKLSPFQQAPIMNNSPYNCTFVLLRYPKTSGFSIKNSDYFMTADDIPSVLSYLQDNGYIVDTAITTLLNKSKLPIGGVSETRISGNRKLIFSIAFKGIN